MNLLSLLRPGKSAPARQPLLAGNTRRLHDFHGGIHPPQHKTLSNQTPIRPGPIPHSLVLPLNMHIGAPALPCVQVGDTVLKGQKIAEPSGPVSAAVHAPTSGVIRAIEARPIQHPSGLDALCIVLDSDGEDRWAPLTPHPDYHQLPRAELVGLIREAGIAGMGGAGFPTAIKVNLRDSQRIEQLIINAVECEPYITADDLLMRERAEGVIAGVQALQYLVQPQETLIGIEDNKPEAIAAMRAAAAGTDIEIVVVPTKYPSGGEKQLIQILTGKEVRAGGLPAEVGVVCHNTGTAWAIHRLLSHGEPLISRITTLTGTAFSAPGNVEVLLGTQVKDLLAFGGVNLAEHGDYDGRLIMGGPMMGFSIDHPTVPVVKTTNCIIAAPAQELPEPEPEQPCIRCGACAEVCPADLLPQQLYWYSKAGEFDRAQHYNLMDCIECGACAYVCPSHIPLVQYYRFAKGALRQQAAEQQKADRARERFEARTARIEREKAEKEAKRQARLAANRQKQAPGSNSAPAVDMAALKAASLEASSAYKAAVKALKAAEAAGEDIDALRAEADTLKARADAAKAAVRDAKASGAAATPAAPASDPVADLKKAVAAASSAYKQAVKAAKEAEASGSAEAAALRAEADTLKGRADELKNALREAKDQAPAVTAAPPAADPVAELKKAVGEASSQYKNALKAAKAAAEDNADDADALRARADELKARADQLKAELRDAKDRAPAVTVAPVSSVSPATSTMPTETDAAAPVAASTDAESAARAKRMKALKTAFNMANKQWKDASAALERATREGADDLDVQQARVDKLKKKADLAKTQLNLLVDEAKAAMKQATGSDLKTLKLAAARTESAAREKTAALAAAREAGDEAQIAVLQQELAAAEQAALEAARTLKQAVADQGLADV
ncbi:electron transport complex subunit RsxC [Alcanivorax sp. JB21]|uniref:electron transport complex subunit RsxC n=1 Tax=Alcanivorax limicola TaxID=2874102 RepID=UPI001CBCE4F7|nr:electron transport complex subunit RsxC [Alcanivorax limicola]MBZ2188361.1 electron transport complex subunit RsxC [Alcanivorax limicola]